MNTASSSSFTNALKYRLLCTFSLKTGKKKYYTTNIHRTHTNIKNNHLNFRNMFHVAKCFPTHKTSVCLPVKNLNHDFQFSKLSVKTDLDNELMDARGEGIVREIVMVMHILYLKQKTNKDLSYSTWNSNSAHCCMAAWIGGDLGEDGCMYMYG